jgi:CO/xanthine dehydrogenase FAD-binding subunit
VCNASPCADTLPPLVALGARLVLLSKRGRREVGVDEAVAAPYETVLEEDEILSEIHIPQMTPGAGSKFIKLGRRNALSISRMSFAAIVGRGDDGRMREVRIAAGSVAPTTRRFVEIEEMLTGRMPGSDLFAAAGRELAALMVRLVGRRWSTPYKEPVVAALARRALAGAAGWKE